MPARFFMRPLVSGIQIYTSGLPIGVTTSAPLPIFNGTNRPNVLRADWRAPLAGSEFNPLVDRYLDRAAFAQPVGQLGNAPRINGDVRRPWNLTENLSVAKTIALSSGFSGRARKPSTCQRVLGGSEPNFNISISADYLQGMPAPAQPSELYW